MTAAGLRVRQAREFKGLSQTQLAKELGVSQPTVANYERDIHETPVNALELISRITGFPPTFFRLGDPPPVATETVRFREHSRLRARDRDYARITIELGYELLIRISSNVRLPALRLPDRTFHSAEEAATSAREALGIPLDRPVDHACRAIERGGVRIFQVPATAEGSRLQAFSGWAGEELSDAFITLYRTEAGDRLRWSVAHEMGHLILHRRMPEEEKAESEANAFAAAFLMPADAIKRDFGSHVTLSTLADLKRHWRVSMQALIMRAGTLGLLDERRKRSLFVQLSRRGWRTKEPISIPPERPRLLRQIVEARYGDPPDVVSLSRDVGLPIDLLTALLLEQQPSIGMSQPGSTAELIDLNSRRSPRSPRL
jgi:Zn-dependent peptidase ImmA (M78 family)/transcriptional regulator with XRE-family HTH domain